MIKNFSVIPEDRIGAGAIICLIDKDLPISKNVNAIPISYV